MTGSMSTPVNPLHPSLTLGFGARSRLTRSTPFRSERRKRVAQEIGPWTSDAFGVTETASGLWGCFGSKRASEPSVAAGRNGTREGYSISLRRLSFHRYIAHRFVATLQMGLPTLLLIYLIVIPKT